MGGRSVIVWWGGCGCKKTTDVTHRVQVSVSFISIRTPQERLFWLSWPGSSAATVATGQCVCVYVCLWCYSRCFVSAGVCASAGGRREERYHPSSPCVVWVRERERQCGGWGSEGGISEIHRHPEVLWYIILRSKRGTGARPVCVCVGVLRGGCMCVATLSKHREAKWRKLFFFREWWIKGKKGERFHQKSVVMGNEWIVKK